MWLVQYVEALILLYLKLEIGGGQRIFNTSFAMKWADGACVNGRR